MASNVNNATSSTKRNRIFGQFLSTKNLSIFRHKSAEKTTHAFDEPKKYRSQINITSDKAPMPVCIGRGWLKKRLPRPISLDFDLIKDILINSDEHNQHGSQKRIGTIVEDRDRGEQTDY